MIRFHDCKHCIWNKRAECGRDFCMFPRCVMSSRKKRLGFDPYSSPKA